MFGWTSDEALGKQANTPLQTQFPQTWEAIEAEVLRAGHWEGEIIRTWRGGTPLVVASRSADSSELPHETLSDREFQVLRLIASGKSVTEIAAELSLSSKTVSTYRVRLLQKMNLKTNAELMHYAMQNHLID